MKTSKKLVIALSTLAFLLVAVGFCTPGWVIFHMDAHKMTELQLKKAPIQVQQQYKQQQQLLRQQNPNIPDVKSMSFFAGPFYIRYCVSMTTMGVDASICPVLSSGDVIFMVKTFARNATTGPIAQVMQGLKESGSTMTIDSILNTYVTVVVISSLILIQSAVSLILSIAYTCIRYPRKRFGMAGAASAIFSGVVTFLLVVVFLISFVQMTDAIKKSMEGGGDLGFPYSTMLCCFGAVIFCIAAGLLIRVTLSSKEQFNYEMMVIDNSKGGGTYIAKT